MKKIITLLFLFLITASVIYSQTKLVPIWQKCQTKNTMPSYFGDETERGMACGIYEGEEKLFVVSRANENYSLVEHDPASGEVLGTYTFSSVITGRGYFKLSDVCFSNDEMVYMSNMTLNSESDSLVFYKWTSPFSDPVPVAGYNGATGARMGDHFTVDGKCSDNSITFYATCETGDGDVESIVILKTADNGKTFNAKNVALNPKYFGYLQCIQPLGDGSFLLKGLAGDLVKYTADGTFVESASTAQISNKVSSFKYINAPAGKFILGFAKDRLFLYDISGGIASTKLVAYSDSLGNVTNSNGGGDCSYKLNKDGSLVFYVLAANNGLAAFGYTPVTAVKESSNLPGSFKLKQNFPNPFNPTTSIEFELATSSNVSLKVFDVLGREVASLVNEQLLAGQHKVTFNAASLSSGIYYYRIETSGNNCNNSETKIMTLLK